MNFPRLCERVQKTHMRVQCEGPNRSQEKMARHDFHAVFMPILL